MRRSPPPLKPPGSETSGRFKKALKAALLAGICIAPSACGATQTYSYTHLPSGYHWRAVYDRTTNAVVFYGQDPLTLETVYVGPDNKFFIYRHPGPIGPKDLTMHWNPHDAQ